MHIHVKKNNDYNCYICARQFNSKYILERHLFTHEQVRKFQCSHCPQAFLKLAGLQNHVGIHTGALSFKCGLCPSAFNFSSSATLHRRAHLVNGNYFCYKCSLPVKSFKQFKSHLLGCNPEALFL